MEKIKYNSYTTVIKIPFNEINKIDMALCKQPKQTLKAFYDGCTVKPNMLINGGFFGLSDGSTCFNYMDEKELIHTTNLYQWGIGVVDEKTLYYGSLNGRSDWRDFISGYPVYIDNYEAVNINFAQELNYKARRSILGFDPDYMYLVAIDSPGMAYKAIQNMLVELKVQYAINLDGGGSTRVLENGQCITNGSENRAVDNVIAIYLAKAVETVTEKTNVIYRVQVGCFSIRNNAERFLQQIKALGGIYLNAYIRQVNNLFKIQVGAFSIKANAEQMKDDLKSKGFNCFITTN